MKRPKEAQQPDPSALTDDECDFIIQRIGWMLRDAVNPQEFFRANGRGVVFEPSDRESARAWVRAFVRAGA
jgi:hypothetical protein